MLGKIEGRRGRQRIRWLDSITDSVDMGLGGLRVLVMYNLACCGSGGRKESDATELNFHGRASLMEGMHSFRTDENLPSCVSLEPVGPEPLSRPLPTPLTPPIAADLGLRTAECVNLHFGTCLPHQVRADSLTPRPETRTHFSSGEKTVGLR